MDSNKVESGKYDSGFYSSQMEGSYRSALRVLPIINNLIKPNSVLDIGCGVGSWLKAWKEINPDIQITGVDGDYVTVSQLLIAENDFVAKDLKQEFNFDRQFDLVMSLEVGEHLPTQLSEVLVKNLIKHGKYVLFSAAIPYQQGTFHINEQFPEFWARLFDKYDYVPVDIVRKEIWSDDSVEWWYRQNIILFVHKTELGSHTAIAESAKSTNPHNLARIHPQLWIYYNEDIRKATKSIFSFIRWKLSPFKKKIFR